MSECVYAGKYLEIFGRKNNLRDYWVTVGNEVTGTGQHLYQCLKEVGLLNMARSVSEEA